jgi:plastocyanin
MATQPAPNLRPVAVAVVVAATLVAVVLATTSASLGHNATTDTGAVKMTASRFAPEVVTIAIGSRLRLVNRSGYGHTLAIGMNATALPQAGAPNFGQHGVRHAGPGETWTTPPWTASGTYQLTCTIHPRMNLAVQVVTAHQK